MLFRNPWTFGPSDLRTLGLKDFRTLGLWELLHDLLILPFTSSYLFLLLLPTSSYTQMTSEHMKNIMDGPLVLVSEVGNFSIFQHIVYYCFLLCLKYLKCKQCIVAGTLMVTNKIIGIVKI